MSYKILVIGDSCIDRFHYGTVDRICPEAPCPVFLPTYQTENYGMALNVYNNIVGLARLWGKDVKVHKVTNAKHPVKTRYVEERSNQMIMREDVDDIIQPVKLGSYNIDWDSFDCTIVSDYNKGFLSEEKMHDISLMSKLCFLDTKKQLGEWANQYDFIKINNYEWDKSKHTNHSGIWNNRVIITKGKDGAEYNGKQYPASEVKNVVDISGAGDTFLASLAFQYLITGSIHEAIKLSNEAAGLVISKKGVSVI